MQNFEQPIRGSYHYVSVEPVGTNQFTAERHPHQIYGHHSGYDHALQQRSHDQKSLHSEAIPLRGSYQDTDHFYGKHKPFSRRCRCDFAATILCLLLYSMIVLGVGSFIYFSKAKENAEGWVDGKTVANAFAYALGLAAIAASLNEALIDRCWRRMKYQALRGSIRGSMRGSHLRAANFQLAEVLRRIMKRKISKRELGTLFSHILLRWGTLLGFSTI